MKKNNPKKFRFTPIIVRYKRVSLLILLINQLIPCYADLRLFFIENLGQTLLAPKMDRQKEFRYFATTFKGYDLMYSGNLVNFF